MTLIIKNIGLVKHAEIKFDGLTIIAGENDTGKSSVGKVMFSIIKAFSRYEKDFNEDKKREVQKAMEELHLNLRSFRNDEEVDFWPEFFPPVFFKAIEEYIDSALYCNIEEIIDHKISLLKKLSSKDLESATNRLLKIKEIAIGESEKHEYIKKALTLALYSEFRGSLSSKFTDDDSEISYNTGGNVAIKVMFKGNKIESLIDHATLNFNETTYIETPFALQMHDLIRRSNAFLDEELSVTKRKRTRDSVPFHFKDLAIKLENARYYDDFDEIFDDFVDGIDKDGRRNLLKKIKEVTGGKATFDNEKEVFNFNKTYFDETYSFQTSSTASGIKSFNILELLLKANDIEEKSLLIIDEPEVHLHPKWQIEYVKIIIELVKAGVPILVTTHSPYILQALKVYSERAKITDKVNFYHAEKEENGYGSQITLVNDDLNTVFRRLSAPLQDLVWGE